MIAYEIYCEYCNKHMGMIFNPIKMDGWFCSQECIDKYEGIYQEKEEEKEEYYFDGFME